MTEAQRIEYAVGILSRLPQAVFPQRRPASIGLWHPLPHHCHDNVRTWVAAKPEHKHVYGFMVFEFPTYGYVEVAAHSLVEIEDGSLVDITPHGAEFDWPFIRHIGTMDDFAGMAEHFNTRISIELVRLIRREQAKAARAAKFRTAGGVRSQT